MSTDLLESLLGGVLGGSGMTAVAERWFRAADAKPDVAVLFLGRKVCVHSSSQHYRCFSSDPSSMLLMIACRICVRILKATVDLLLQVDASNMGQLTHLDAALNAAPASVSMPYMHHEVRLALTLAPQRCEINHLGLLH